MKKGYNTSRQPAAHEIQPLLHLLNSGHVQQAEQGAKALLHHYPNAPVLHHILGPCLAAQSKYEEAVISFKRAVAAMPNMAELHYNLGAVLTNLQRHEEAIASYKKAVALAPGFADAHFNLGIAFQAEGRSQEAAEAYQRAIALQPGFFEAYGNLGTVLQQQGKLAEAINCYRKVIEINPDAIGYFNLATALRDQGKLDDSIAHYRQAISMSPNYAQAYNNMGEVFRDQGNMQEAVSCYKQALAITPSHAQANYNLAQFLYDAGRLDEAISYFDKSQINDWQERKLYCLYKSGQFERFREQLQPMLKQKNDSPFLATLSTHYAINFGVSDPYRFCSNPMDFVYHNHIPDLAETSELRYALLRDIHSADIAERKQGRLHHGIQSAGNLFKRPEVSFARLAELVRREVANFRERFAGQDCELIRSFPQSTDFSSSWYVKMRSGGHLTSHIHEEGWLSGSVYLSLPKQKSHPHEGSIEFSTHGDDYPKRHDAFPAKAIAPEVGDIVLFPSSLFHRTIPFSSDEERICVAFDVQPKSSRVVFSSMRLIAFGWMVSMMAELADILMVARFARFVV